jgi:hypothetical protein
LASNPWARAGIRSLSLRAIFSGEGLCPETRVVSVVEEQVPVDRLGIDKRRPAAPADLIALVATLPGELDTDLAVPLDRTAVQPAADGDETELAGLTGELDETRLDQIDGIGPTRSFPRSVTGRSTAPQICEHPLA